MNLDAKRKNNWPLWPIFLLHCLVSLGLGGCGKAATAEECQRIVERITELELKEANIANAAEIQEQVSRTQGAFKERTLKDCVGQRISASALDCVENATKARQIVEQCFD